METNFKNTAINNMAKILLDSLKEHDTTLNDFIEKVQEEGRRQNPTEIRFHENCFYINLGTDNIKNMMKKSFSGINHYIDMVDGIGNESIEIIFNSEGSIEIFGNKNCTEFRDYYSSWKDQLVLKINEEQNKKNGLPRFVYDTHDDCGFFFRDLSAFIQWEEVVDFKAKIESNGFSIRLVFNYKQKSLLYGQNSIYMIYGHEAVEFEKKYEAYKSKLLEDMIPEKESSHIYKYVSSGNGFYFEKIYGFNHFKNIKILEAFKGETSRLTLALSHDKNAIYYCLYGDEAFDFMIRFTRFKMKPEKEKKEPRITLMENGNGFNFRDLNGAGVDWTDIDDIFITRSDTSSSYDTITSSTFIMGIRKFTLGGDDAKIFVENYDLFLKREKEEEEKPTVIKFENMQLIDVCVNYVMNKAGHEFHYNGFSGVNIVNSVSEGFMRVEFMIKLKGYYCLGDSAIDFYNRYKKWCEER